MKVFEDLEARGLVKQTTNAEKIRSLLNDTKATFYIGFDPTADSLHVGHLLQLVLAKRLVDAGHKAIILIGEATASIGDPTGKTDMRKMLSQSEIKDNHNDFLEQIMKLLGRTVSFVNNMQWFEKKGFLEILREVGPHFSVNNMLRADCFKSRMESGLSFLEFNYMIMQAFDFLHLNRIADCNLQIGGDDQWSNILAGIDLIHKKEKKEAFGLTLPLLVNSSGQKMGKTEKGAVWLNAEKTSPFDFFQFWRNLPDTEVIKCLKMLTFLPVEEINKLPFTTPDEINFTKKMLAFELTKMVHGEGVANESLQKAEALFAANDPTLLEATVIDNNISVLDLLVKCGFAKSKSEGRNLINGRGISINDQVVTEQTLVITSDQFTNDVIIRKGKKNFSRLLIKETNE